MSLKISAPVVRCSGPWSSTAGHGLTPQPHSAHAPHAAASARSPHTRTWPHRRTSRIDRVTMSS
eukprot:4762424-Prymnesium_polylepis.1